MKKTVKISIISGLILTAGWMTSAYGLTIAARCGWEIMTFLRRLNTPESDNIVEDIIKATGVNGFNRNVCERNVLGEAKDLTDEERRTLAQYHSLEGYDAYGNSAPCTANTGIFAIGDGIPYLAEKDTRTALETSPATGIFSMEENTQLSENNSTVQNATQEVIRLIKFGRGLVLFFRARANDAPNETGEPNNENN